VGKQVHLRKIRPDEDMTDDVVYQVARDLPGLSGAPFGPCSNLNIAVSSLRGSRLPRLMLLGV
jgi:hypothetical protein